MSLEEEGAYIRLISYCWQHGSIPSDPLSAAKLIGKGASTTLATTVLTMFEPSHDPGRYVHDRLEKERAKQAEWKRKSAEGGRKSAEMRSKGGSTTVQPPLPNGTNHSSTLQSLTPSLSLNLNKFNSLGDLDGSEKEFMAAITPMLGRDSMKNWGGLWRKRFRENRDISVRVMRDIAAGLKDGTINDNPGGYADKLWKEFV